MSQATNDSQTRPQPTAATRSLTQLGQWRLVRLLSAGSWSQVYQAAPLGCTSSAADYVVKALRPEFAADPAANRMFRREAALGRRISHPNLSAVLAAELERPPYYLVMPYVEGATLAATLQYSGRLKTPHALWIARQLTLAFSRLHQANWLHTDIKPTNVFLSVTGHATLLDLGLARPLAVDQDGHEPFVGTPDYAAPEWFSEACRPGPWSDVYSLGVTLFEMLTGRLPGNGATAEERPHADWHRPAADARTIVPSLPRGVARLLRQMLAIEPIRRPTPRQLINRFIRLELETLDERV